MKQKLKVDLKSAMRARESEQVGTLRLLLSEIQNAEIKKKGELDPDECLTVLTREVKKRREAAEAFAKGDRPEMAQKELQELAILETYLPKAMTEVDVRALVAEIIAQVQPQSMRDMGKVMGPLMGKVKGRFDGKAASVIVREEMAKL